MDTNEHEFHRSFETDAPVLDDGTTAKDAKSREGCGVVEPLGEDFSNQCWSVLIRVGTTDAH